MERPIRVLIADDHPIVREGLATVLNQEADLDVVGRVEDGAQAVAAARRLHRDVVLMDLQMPIMDGVEAIQRIKQDTPDTEVIILTTYDTDDYIFRGVEAGAKAYLLKDSPPEEVLRPIRMVHRGESLIEPKVASRLLDRFTQLSQAPREGGLSAREVEVVELIAEGIGNKEIATRLTIGESTMKTHLIHIFNKLGVKGRAEAVAEAARKGIIRL